MREIKIYTKFDIITARMRVRGVAREAGFADTDQVRIALATWSVAHVLGLGDLRPGLILVDRLIDGARTGVRVVCTKANGTAPHSPHKKIDDLRWMVDELTIEQPTTSQMQVTLVKWPGDSKTL